jgi:Druantia protein DruA
VVSASDIGSAAWKCQVRDRFIGWTQTQRSQRLHLLTNNTRFLILPWVRVRYLASWTLSHVLGRLSQDWRRKYGHGIALGATTGRSRQDRDRTLCVPDKDVYVCALQCDFRKVLGG